MGHNGKRQAFVEHYLRCFNAAEAARLAGYSERTARQQGSRLLTKVDIQAAIEARLNELKMQADEVLVRLTDQARGSMADFIEVDESGDVNINLKAAKANNSLHLVRKIRKTTKHGKTGNETSVEIELYDSQAALVQLSRIHGLNNDRVQVDWRFEFEQAGIDPDAIKSELVAEFEQHIRAGANRVNAGGTGDSEGTS